jgi:hypothetical protein
MGATSPADCGESPQVGWFFAETSIARVVVWNPTPAVMTIVLIDARTTPITRTLAPQDVWTGQTQGGPVKVTCDGWCVVTARTAGTSQSTAIPPLIRCLP